MLRFVKSALLALLLSFMFTGSALASLPRADRSLPQLNPAFGHSPSAFGLKSVYRTLFRAASPNNRMTGASNISPAMDAFYYHGTQTLRLYKQVNNAGLRFSLNGNMVEAEHPGTPDEAMDHWRWFIPGLGLDDRVAMVDMSGSTATAVHYYMPNRIGSVIGMVDGVAGASFGVLTDQYLYSPYGVEEPLAGSGNMYRYTGRYYDGETGLYYYRSRYYDPGTGRFPSPDSILYDGGLNLYNYVGGNPINNVDPLGEEKVVVSIIAGFAAPTVGGRGILSISFDTKSLEINTSVTAGVQVGAKATLKLFGSIQPSQKLGNRLAGEVKAFTNLSASANTPVASGTIKGEFATSIAASTTEGFSERAPKFSVVKQASTILDRQPGDIGFGFSLGQASGVQATGSLNISLPDTANAAATSAKNFADGLFDLLPKPEDFIE